MKPHTISPAFTTDKVAETKAFYVKYFNATITFDCGWYINLSFGAPSATLQFMEPQGEEQQPGSGAGLIYNFAVDDVDREYTKLTGAGLEPVMPLEDHPWGDRGFAVQDPNGITIYLYSEREPSADFKPFFLTNS
jgi:uncharacterized glyoxalase superfamily protein PhnB